MGCILVTPGSPAQMLLVHEALTSLADRTTELQYLRCVPLGYFNIDHEKSQESPLSAVAGKVYGNLFPHWLHEVNRTFGPSTRNGAGGSSRADEESPPGADNVQPVKHERLKAYVFEKLAREGRSLVEGWKLMIDLSDEDTVLMTGGPVTNLGQAIRE